jgi:Resolvase, N terminal domain
MSVVVASVPDRILDSMRVIGYARSMADERDVGPDVRAAVIRAEAAAHGWELVDMVVDRGSSSELDRPLLVATLNILARREVDALVVTGLEQLTSSLTSLGILLERFQMNRWVLVVLSARTEERAAETDKDGGSLRVSSDQDTPGAPAAGVSAASTRRQGAPRRCPDHILTQIVELRASGARLMDICSTMNANGVPTPGGGSRWWPSHVHRLLATQDARQRRAEIGAAR